MRLFYSPLHMQHNPSQEIYDGVASAYAEVPDRVTGIAHRLENDGLQLKEPGSFTDTHILAVHDPHYVDFVRQRSNLLHELETLFPSYYITDTYAPLVNGTFAAARASVDCALSGADAMLQGEQVVYSLCRPPGHHACSRSMGGYCYFNNAAIAAHYLSAHGRVAILDIDYHHGNGTQEIFYDRADVLYVSLHADPTIAYPYATGFADETGRGPGQGFTRNFPLGKNTTWTTYAQVLQQALQTVNDFNPDFLIVSVGFDTFSEDPIAGLELTADDYVMLGQRIASMPIPTLLVQEGGYNVAALPQLASNFLRAFR